MSFRFLLFIFVPFCLAQINTESMRNVELENGWGHSFSYHLTYHSGNTNFSKYKTQFRTNYKKDVIYCFIVGRYEKGKKDETLFLHRGFLHFRLIRKLALWVSLECFAQEEFNDFINLKNREILGAGGRFKWHPHEQFTAFLGVGLMKENEEFTSGESAKLLRSTNYLTLKWHSGKITFGSTEYFQLDTGNFSDFRILSQNELNVSLFKNFEITTQFNLRYDSIPPTEIESLDMEISNGFRLSF
ncbi:DUF481 domain-containing protein [bacterium]|nr:DUF481 domain-containing protein [bacterium]